MKNIMGRGVLFRLAGPEFLAVTRRLGNSLDTNSPFLAGSSRQGGRGSRAAGPFHLRTRSGTCAVLRDALGGSGGYRVVGGWREAPRFTAMLPLAKWPRGRLDRRREPSSRAVGAHSNRPLLGQHGEFAQSDVAVDALIDAGELVGILRCCSWNAPERRGSLPMSLLPPRGCGFAGRDSLMPRFPLPVPFSLTVACCDVNCSDTNPTRQRGKCLGCHDRTLAGASGWYRSPLRTWWRSAKSVLFSI